MGGPFTAYASIWMTASDDQMREELEGEGLNLEIQRQTVEAACQPQRWQQEVR